MIYIIYSAKVCLTFTFIPQEVQPIEKMKCICIKIIVYKCANSLNPCHYMLGVAIISLIVHYERKRVSITDN